MYKEKSQTGSYYSESFRKEMNPINPDINLEMDEEEPYDNPANIILMSDGPSHQKKKMCCNCKKSRCLKLYCDCFAAGEFCMDCNCTNCANLPENEEERYASMMALMERNPFAFKPKLDRKENDFQENDLTEEENNKLRHSKGCNCKKSGCMKKYCECFQAGVLCTDLCKCDNCKNCDAHNPGFRNKGEVESDMNEEENSQFASGYQEEMNEKRKSPPEQELMREAKIVSQTNSKSKKKAKELENNTEEERNTESLVDEEAYYRKQDSVQFEKSRIKENSHSYKRLSNKKQKLAEREEEDYPSEEIDITEEEHIKKSQSRSTRSGRVTGSGGKKRSVYE